MVGTTDVKGEADVNGFLGIVDSVAYGYVKGTGKWREEVSVN